MSRLRPPEAARAAARSAQAPSAPRRIVRCPTCGGDSVYSPENPYRPFCSERCKQIDLGAWGNEDFRVPDESPPDDVPFGDPKAQ